MRRLFTLLLVCSVALVASAQTSKQLISDMPTLSPAENADIQAIKAERFAQFDAANASRAVTKSFYIDYDGEDELYAANVTGGDYGRFRWDLNRNWSNSDNLTTDYAMVVFDTIMNYPDGESYPLADVTMNLDSIDFLFSHQNVTGTINTVRVQVYDRSTLSITGSGAGASVNGTVLWEDSIQTTTSLTAAINTAEVFTFAPDLAFAQGETFVIRVDYWGDTADHFNFLAGFRDDCGGSCAAAESSVNGPETSPVSTNSLYYINFTNAGPPVSNISGINRVGYDCDGDGTVGTPFSCENMYIQNIIYIPYITADIEFGATVDVDYGGSRCKDDLAKVSINAYGGVEPYTYSWSPSTGVVSPTSNETDVAIQETSTNYTVTITDDNGDMITVPIQIASDAITVNTGADQTIACGDNANILATLGGNTSGATYLWNNGSTSPSLSGISAAGSYSITVTNSSGCTATDATTVSYGGVSQNVAFTAPAPLCQNYPATFTNNSTYKGSGWNWQWNFGNGDVSFAENGTVTYSTAGPYTVSLTADSAGCTFFKNQSVTVLSETDVACVNIGIESPEFAKNISMYPNPTSGTVAVSILGENEEVEIAVYNMQGAEVYTERVEVNGAYTGTIELGNLSAGSYLVKFQSAERVATKSIVLNK